ncbi:TIGR01777 family oxidoreductase [Flavobacterium psychrotrophum]|uniref:TIGR01777 family oxidoreductase n=1 Tax=Flavobacterium psychrotrophum TaxID=2294119 RepID=UPI000E323B87|nr:TIGR01777 family oxidoreductase [Flavobacterium psychrotrophum]
MKKLVIAAGTGFLGQVLVAHFKDVADQIIILTRGNARIDGNVKYVHWDARTLTGWERELERADTLINLAGKSVNCRYTEKNKQEIISSRVDSTIILSKAIQQCNYPPKNWLNSSTATIYRHSKDKQMDEATGEIGDDFSMNVAKMWERVFFAAETPGTKKIALRTSIVLGKNGGAFPMLLKLAKLGLGGKQGSGDQFVSWLHESDFARAVDFIINRKIDGVINVVAPTPVKNDLFMKALRTAAGVPFGISQPKWLLQMGATLLGTETELVLKSRNVIPTQLIEQGFEFEFEKIESAFKNLV